MTPKERILNVIQGKTVDRIPWSPNLAYWWDAQSDSLVNKGEVEFLKTIGADALIRGHYPMYGRQWDDMALFKLKYKNTAVYEFNKSNERIKTYETPVGKLDFIYKYSSSGNTWFLSKHPVKSEEDYKILTYIFEDTILEADYKRYDEESSRYGDQALLVPILAPFFKSGFQTLVEFWAGTEEIAYAVMDYPEVVEGTLAAMKKVSKAAVQIAAESNAEAFTTWEDTSTTNISPAFYKEYIVPELNEWCDILHKSDKLYIQHACGHLHALMPIIAETGIDCIESISPPPTGNIEIWDARSILPENISLIGGIEPTVFLNSTMDELEGYVDKLLTKMKGSRYILANIDSCPPGVELKKFKLMNELVNRFR